MKCALVDGRGGSERNERMEREKCEERREERRREKPRWEQRKRKRDKVRMSSVGKSDKSERCRRGEVIGMIIQANLKIR